MANQTISENVSEIVAIAKSYINTRIELWKLSLLEKISLAGSYFIVTIVVVFIIAFCLLFISLAFAFWYGEVTGDLAGGFLILAGFYLLLGLILILGRKSLILGPIIRSLSAIMYENDEPEEKGK